MKLLRLGVRSFIFMRCFGTFCENIKLKFDVLLNPVCLRTPDHDDRSRQRVGDRPQPAVKFTELGGSAADVDRRTTLVAGVVPHPLFSLEGSPADNLPAAGRSLLLAQRSLLVLGTGGVHILELPVVLAFVVPHRPALRGGVRELFWHGC